MTKTDYKINGEAVEYELLEDGYFIYIGGRKSIHQYEPYIPYPSLGYEGSCLKQIDEMCNPAPVEQPEIEQLKEQLEIQAEAIEELAALLGGE